MGLEAALNMVESRLHTLLETVTDLHTTIEYWPPSQLSDPQDTPALVDIFGNSAEDLIGWTMEALASLRSSQAAARSGDYDDLRRGLATCHMQAVQITQRLVADLMPYERIADLMRVGRTRGGEWRPWAMSVKQALDQCRQPLFDLQQAEFECWQEIAERIGSHTISVQTTSIGMQMRQARWQDSVLDSPAEPDRLV